LKNFEPLKKTVGEEHVHLKILSRFLFMRVLLLHGVWATDWCDNFYGVDICFVFTFLFVILASWKNLIVFCNTNYEIQRPPNYLN